VGMMSVCTTVADAYLTAASHTAGAVAEQGADRKCLKYTDLSAAYEFQPVALKTHGPSSASTVSRGGSRGFVGFGRTEIGML